MDIDSTKLTVFFEAPFWIGVFERIERRKLSVCKVVFGAEPKDYEVWEYLLKNYSRLRFSPSVETVVKKESVNPKRLQRQIRKETAATGIGTKSQQALQMQREENKLVRKALSRKQREAEKQRQFELKQQKQVVVLVPSRVWGRHAPTRSCPKGAGNFQELKICGHGTILALTKTHIF